MRLSFNRRLLLADFAGRVCNLYAQRVTRASDEI